MIILGTVRRECSYGSVRKKADNKNYGDISMR
jgi:hypothetical protein